MDRKLASILVVLGVAVMALVIGCGSGAAAPGKDEASQLTATAVPADTHADGETHDATDTAPMDDHDLSMGDMHEADEHSHGDAMVDPDAPMTSVVAKEFGYTPGHFEVEAGHPFTIMLHNEGALEHDITIEGHEDLGGIHLAPDGEGMASFTLDEGEYTYYCTVLGHRDAGMSGTLIVEAHGH